MPCILSWPLHRRPEAFRDNSPGAQKVLRHSAIGDQTQNSQVANLQPRSGKPVKKAAKKRLTQPLGGPERIRTSDLRFRKPLLYPTELRDQLTNFVSRTCPGPISVR